jgi:hypothetical protein
MLGMPRALRWTLASLAIFGVTTFTVRAWFIVTLGTAYQDVIQSHELDANWLTFTRALLYSPLAAGAMLAIGAALGILRSKIAHGVLVLALVFAMLDAIAWVVFTVWILPEWLTEFFGSGYGFCLCPAISAANLRLVWSIATLALCGYALSVVRSPDVLVWRESD